MTQSKIERRVMAGVGVIYAMRRLTSRVALECYALFVSAFGIGAFVSVPHVAHNFSEVAQGGLGHIESFALVAVSHTSTWVQLALAVGVAAFVFLISDVVRSLSSARSGALAF